MRRERPVRATRRDLYAVAFIVAAALVAYAVAADLKAPAAGGVVVSSE